ncbi:MAG: hypothetical protein F4Y00_00800 [Bacteroidetes bacterium SB0662_bin_6]|nr:hypothetical protein [Bacteroidetes bacterium SB0668_bin_1]MYE03505.1 hypothetical protein [Bacteroidetes bacterium SB0662_bin_6]
MPRNLFRSGLLRASIGATAAILLLLLVSGRLTGRTLHFIDIRGETDENSFTLEQLDTHPDIVFPSWFSDPLAEEDAAAHEAFIRNRLVRDFRDFLALYVQRQGKDDNFTLRVVDNRTDELLEIHELNREDWENRTPDAPWDWALVDEQRRRQTRALVDKYVGQGIPRRAVTVKWGRRNQVLEARMRELGYIEYEVRLANFLGLSLLATETGTVETFNRDDLVSAAGARGRYQIMPFLLRLNDIHRYRLRTTAGNTIRVYEERHPFLTMETAFTTIAGYRNAVGHEIPGLSAYHSGPGNIFMLYRTFLEKGGDFHTRESTVMDAYIWAITDGFDQLSSSSFRTHSRGYVASAYGSLRATESLPVEKAATLQVERVQLRDGERINLSRLLELLPPGADLTETNAYDRFREHNPHFLLPERPGSQPGVPPAGDVQLASHSGQTPVRFFLPAGSIKALFASGFDGIDPEKTFHFGQDTYSGAPWSYSVSDSSGAFPRTVWDRQYDELVQEIARFGFTNENRERLAALTERFEALAREEPSFYRDIQLKIIRTHHRLWHSDVFDRLAAVVRATGISEEAESE